MKKLIPVLMSLVLFISCTKAVDKPTSTKPLNEIVVVKFYTAVNTTGMNITVNDAPYTAVYSAAQPDCNEQTLRSLYLEGGKSYKVTVGTKNIFMVIPAHVDGCYIVSIQ